MSSHEDRQQGQAGVAASELDDPRVVEALDEYLGALESGEKPSRPAFLARHADIALALAQCLEGMEALHGAASAPDQLTKEMSGAVQSVEQPPGTPLGDFRIIREVGRGGMGIVYEAEQLSLGRRVALKVLPFAAALDAKQLQRFKNEAQAAAQLHHSNIVPVYAVGAERGVYFYAMQLIQGQNLAALIDELRRYRVPQRSGSKLQPAELSTDPFVPPPQSEASPDEATWSILGAQLSTKRSERAFDFFRTIAQLVAQAADGLDYAHGVGIVHRDVKPANLLVDDRGTVWLTDFGLAQLHADAVLTQTGDLLGTLRYMSPEQAGGLRVPIDHRTDVYSLGATLYELLTLRPILDGANRQTLLRQILEEEPRPPRSVDPSIPPELETIVLKAISKVPAERYATARDFADDLRRFLLYEPIRARRATLPQRARKWLRRHPSVLVAGVVLLVLLAAGSLAGAWLIQGEQEKTRQAYERERERAEEAEARFRLARRSADEMIQFAEVELADSPHLQGLRKRLLEAALSYYQEFIEQRRDDPDAQADLAATKARVKKILDDLAVMQGAGELSRLNDKAVLDDLRPSDQQRQRITVLSRRLEEQRHEMFREFHRLTSEERRQRFLDLARANEAAVAEILTPEQRRRLAQIALQFQGLAAFREADIAADLKLTADQKERIRAIEAEQFFGPLGQAFGGHVTLEGRKGYLEKQKAVRERLLAVLTKEQAKRWREMTGDPFKGRISFWPPPGHFRPEGLKGQGGPKRPAGQSGPPS